MPLLFEVKFALKLLSYKVVVYCEDESEQIRRILLRNTNMSENDARLRIEAQLSNSQRLKLADYSISNSGSLEKTRLQIKSLNEIFKNSKKYICIRLALISTVLVILGGISGFFMILAVKFFK